MNGSDTEQHDRFLRLFMSQEESLWGYLRSLLFSVDDVRDVMQDVAVVLWRKFDPGMSGEDFRRWSFGVARMEALAFRRDKARDRLSFGDMVYQLLEDTASEDADETPGRLRALEACLAKLPERQRLLVQAAYAPGARIDEIAKATGRTAMSLYKALHRIRLVLAECVEQSRASEERA
jgi:RNA polymerase sigma-70 factor (ECF subfamily)